MDPRAKNETAQNKQQERVAKKAEQEEVQAAIAAEEPAQLRARLSNKNEDYVFKLQKSLQENGKTAAQAQTLVEQLLTEIVQNQIKGIPARQLYGPVNQKVADLLEQKQRQAKNRRPEFWQMCVDNGLLFAALFGAMYGIIGFTTKNPSRNNQSGIFTIILLALLWGILITWFTTKMQVARKDREPIWKIALVLIVGLLLMYAILGITMIIPAAFNPILPPIWYLVLAVIFYGGRWLFRRYYHIRYNSFTGQ
ncbi:DUF1129 domain-containing protein [Lactobacillus sp. DCY120]|uniref:DUF1129 domain-containing protein n=1 Tax=Bombilactobacillus apium TaxID=2675299 RepID=A0A850R749_9LACO|nr:DUF1129 family protein [Bombilactobacillus apium]NVY96667.1 DUF1129 domain-containing protein [Bombilactobacillus apium]